MIKSRSPPLEPNLRGHSVLAKVFGGRALILVVHTQGLGTSNPVGGRSRDHAEFIHEPLKCIESPSANARAMNKWRLHLAHVESYV